MYNHTVLVGRATRDPESKFSQKGNKVVKFSLATNTGWGEYKRVDFHNCICFGKLADVVEEYVRQGSMLVVDGETNHEKYETDDGETKYYTQVKVSNVKMVGSKKDSENEERPRQEERRVRRPHSKIVGTAATPIDDDDIPF